MFFEPHLTAESNTPVLCLAIVRRLQAPQYPSNPPPEFPIHVSEDDASVTVAAGVSQRLLLDYLANFKWVKNVSHTWACELYYLSVHAVVCTHWSQSTKPTRCILTS